jgi:ribosomal protein S18 acetylase RimI-like enzyme
VETPGGALCQGDRVFEVRDEIPGVDEFCDLRIAAGLSAMDRAAASTALPRSLHAVTIRDAGEADRLIGMGRVVGDGLHVQVTDIAVHPEHQGEGLSRLVLESIMRFIATLPRSTIVTLFADVDWLYQKYGFAVPEVSTGMMLKRWPDIDGAGAGAGA